MEALEEWLHMTIKITIKLDLLKANNLGIKMVVKMEVL